MKLVSLGSIYRKSKGGGIAVMNYGTKFLILSIFPDGNNVKFESETNPNSSFYF